MGHQYRHRADRGAGILAQLFRISFSQQLSCRHTRRDDWDPAARRRQQRLFGVEIESCTRCGGKLKIIASIEEPQLMAKILLHLERAAPEQYQSELPLGARGPPAQSRPSACSTAAACIWRSRRPGAVGGVSSIG